MPSRKWRQGEIHAPDPRLLAFPRSAGRRELFPPRTPDPSAHRVLICKERSLPEGRSPAGTFAQEIPLDVRSGCSTLGAIVGLSASATTGWSADVGLGSGDTAKLGWWSLERQPSIDI